MSQDLLFQLMKQADARLPEEQLRLIAHLADRVSHCDLTPKPRRNVMEFCGIAPHHLGGMDAQAQEYVRRMRRGEFPELEIEARKEQ